MSLIQYSSFVTLLVFFIALDVFQVNHIWGENFHRRAYHHLQRNQYDPYKIPNIHSMNSLLTPEEITDILTATQNVSKTKCLSTWQVSKIFNGQYSKQCALYYDDFSEPVQNLLDSIGTKLLPRLSNQIGQTLYLSNNSNFRSVLLRYYGATSQFGWHYDTEPYDSYRVLALIKSVGKISTFQYMENKVNSSIPVITQVPMNVSDGILFQGTRTYHSVSPSSDENMVRFMIGWQYTTNTSSKPIDMSFCSKLRSSSAYETIRTILPYLLLTGIGVYNINLYLRDTLLVKRMSFVKFIVFLFIATIAIIDKYPPLMPSTIGTRIKSELSVSLKFWFVCLLSTGFDIASSVFLFSYVTLTDMLLPTRLIAPHLDYLN